MYHVVYCFDSTFQPHFGASITSLLVNSKDIIQDLTVHVIFDKAELTEELKSKLEQIQVKFNIQLVMHHPSVDDITRISNFKKPLASPAAFFRVLIGKLLPSVDKVLYLDSDTIVLSSIKELFDVELTSVVAGVLDYSHTYMERRLKIPQYVNSGVLLINLELWRTGDYENKFFNCTIRSLFNDQCILNVITQKDKQLLHSNWNNFILSKTINVPATGILHFITEPKPWTDQFKNTNAALPYWKYLNQSPWANLNLST